jgi:hypothetical protein
MIQAPIADAVGNWDTPLFQKGRHPQPSVHIIRIPDFPAIDTLHNHAFTVHKLFVEIHAFVGVRALFYQMMRYDQTLFI